MLTVAIRKTLKNSRGRAFGLDVSFSSSAGFTVVYGPSGSGKTLTMKAIAGLTAPDAGVIRLGDQVLFDAEAGVNVPARLRNIGYVFQDYALFPHKTVWQNVAFGLEGNWPWRLKDRKKVASLLELFEIAELSSSYPDELSGGQRQRVALARAFI